MYTHVQGQHVTHVHVYKVCMHTYINVLSMYMYVYIHQLVDVKC